MHLYFDESGDYAFPEDRFDCYRSRSQVASWPWRCASPTSAGERHSSIQSFTLRARFPVRW
jgi:hypothetical protein